MTVKTGQSWAGTFVTLDSTGALSAATTGPAGTLYVDGTANGATVTITGSNPYKWSVTLPALTAGQRVDMYITATISTIATAGFVASEQADTALVSEVKADSAAILADTGTDGVVLKAAGLAADAVTKIQTGLATPTNITAAAGVALSAAGVDAILDEVVVGSYTMRQLLTVMSAALAGKLSGGGTTTLTFRGIDDASNVIVATVDASHNRTAVTINV